jgi:multidrug efflux pump subunit AcrB
MTTSATIAGAIPGALNTGIGGELLKPMSIAVIGGLLVSTTLTLFVVPCFYSLADQMVSWVTATRRRARRANSPLIRRRI